MKDRCGRGWRGWKCFDCALIPVQSKPPGGASALLIPLTSVHRPGSVQANQPSHGGVGGGITVVSQWDRACRWNKVLSRGNVRVSLTYYPKTQSSFFVCFAALGTRAKNFQSLDECGNAYLEPLPQLVWDEQIVSGIHLRFLPSVKRQFFIGPVTQTIGLHLPSIKSAPA